LTKPLGTYANLCEAFINRQGENFFMFI
jgi:hypothetical protein